MNHIKVWLLFWAPANRSSHVPIQRVRTRFQCKNNLYAIQKYSWSRNMPPRHLSSRLPSLVLNDNNVTSGQDPFRINEGSTEKVAL